MGTSILVNPSPSGARSRSRHAEELANHRERQWEGEGRNQIDPAVGSPMGNVIEEVVSDGLNTAAQRLHAPR